MKKSTLQVAFTIIASVLLVSNIYATKYIVKVANYTFTPQTITNVAIGDIIRFEWEAGSFDHTATANTIKPGTTFPVGAPTFDAPITSSSPSFEYTVTVAGNYAYYCKLHASPISTSGMVGGFSTGNPTGIQQSSLLATNLSVYPRPAKETANVSFNSNTSEDGLIKVYDIQGKVVLRQEFDAVVGPNIVSVQVDGLNQGLYFMEVYANKKRLGIQKLIKD